MLGSIHNRKKKSESVDVSKAELLCRENYL